MSDEASRELTLEVGGPELIGHLILPLRVRVQGVDAVLISADAYDGLLSASQRSVGVRSRIERDPEIKNFVDERTATQELGVILAGIVHRFGEQRAPSLSGLHRYVMARRKAADAVTNPKRRRRAPRGSR
ncbi:hypothetical protein EEDFHM_03143 [Methylorubrum populi]